jgi:hypothetical protein
MKRRLAAIMVGDVVGYSAMMEQAEEHTAERLGACQSLISEKVGIPTYTGDAERSLKLLDEAEALDPFLPAWCIEERGVALYALGRYSRRWTRWPACCSRPIVPGSIVRRR